MNTAAASAPVNVPGQRVEVLRVGTFRDMHGRDIEITDADLAEMAESYDTVRYRAPVVIGHPQIEDPSWGVIDRFEVEDGRLYAVEDWVDAQFAAMRDAGRYAERSLSFFLPDHPNNPTPGKKSPKHVGWLGAVPPAVTGLARLQAGNKVAALAAYDPADAQVVSLAMHSSDRRWGFRLASAAFRRLREYLIATLGVEKANVILPDWEIESLRNAAEPDDPADTAPAYFAQPAEPPAAHTHDRGPAMSNANPQTVDLAARQQELDAREQRIKSQEDRLRNECLAAQRAEAVAFADGLIAGGQLLPARKPELVELMVALPTDKPVAFAAEDGAQVSRTPTEILRGLLSALPKQIEFGERGGQAVPGEGVAQVAFAAAPGAVVDTSQIALHNKALAYQRTHPGTDYIDAVKSVGG